MVSRSIKEYEQLLEPYGFFRVHQSYLVHRDHVLSVLKKDGYQLLLTGQVQIPVSRLRKEQVLRWLQL